LGWDKKRHRINDDGEPTGTAGKPIYGQIIANDLTNVLVAVVRYFGGTKLGTGGLIDAYKTAASLAIQQSQIVQREALQIIDLSFPYEHLPTVMKTLKSWDMQKLEATVESTCTMKIALTGGRLPEFELWSAELEYLNFHLGDLL
jgi:putative IMPACT (imprinted ancient) family translation regulator